MDAYPSKYESDSNTNSVIHPASRPLDADSNVVLDSVLVFGNWSIFNELTPSDEFEISNQSDVDHLVISH